jgi:small subunit ribosomal protein S16
MAVKMRLQRKGRRKAPYYHIVVADARAPRDGRFIERLGFYNPMTKPATIEIDRDKAYDWLVKGAQPTDTVGAILRFKGVMYKKHLMRGVKKGAMTLEEAETKLAEWISKKESNIASRVEATKNEQEAIRKAIFGEEKITVKLEEEPVAETAAPEKAAEPAAETETAPVAEAPTEAVAEESVATESEAVEEPAAEVDVVEEPAVAETEVVEEPVAEVPAEEAAAETEEPAAEEAGDASEEEK